MHRYSVGALLLLMASPCLGDVVTLNAVTPIATNSVWFDESLAAGSAVTNCNSGNFAYNPVGMNGGDGTFLEANNFEAFALPPGQAITSVEVDAHVRYNDGTTNDRIRMRVSGSVANTTQNSAIWSQTNTSCAWRMGLSTNGWDITSLRPSWTAADINGLDIAVRHVSSAGAGASNQLRVTAFRIVVTTVCPSGDQDGDGDCDSVDNCPTIANSNQADADGDGRGDVCDNCPNNSNFDQIDSDGDGRGNVCDNCPTTFNPSQANADNDSFGDLCDNDTKIILNADSIPDVDDWVSEPNAIGNAATNCNNSNFAYNPIASNGGSTVFLVANSLDTYALPEGHSIYRVEVDAHVRYNNGTTNDRIRMRVSGSVASTEQASAFWNQTDENCAYRMSLSPNGWDVTDLRSSWTAANINNLIVAVRHQASSGGGPSNQLRVTAFRVVVSSSCCPMDSDLDGVLDSLDNCPMVPNTNQANSDTPPDTDTIGDLCDTATKITRTAITVPAATNWLQAGQAEGPLPADCNSDNYAYNPVGMNGGATNFLTATAFQAYTLPAGTVIEKVEVDINARYNQNTTGNRVRMRVSGSVPSNEQNSNSWNQTTTNCNWRMGLSPNGWDITSLRPSWSAADIAALQVAVRHVSSSGGTVNNELRISAFRIVVTSTCCPPPTTIIPPPGAEPVWSNSLIWAGGAIPNNTPANITADVSQVRLDQPAVVTDLNIKPPPTGNVNPGKLHIVFADPPAPPDPEVGHLTVHGTIRNDGELHIGTDHKLIAGDLVSMQGSKGILLNGLTAELASSVSGASMTSGIPVTGRGLLTALYYNNSVVSANVPGGQIDVRGPLSKTNEGVFKAENGGTLKMTSVVIGGAGAFEAMNDGILWLAPDLPPSMVQGGSLYMTTGGQSIIEGSCNLTIGGNANLVDSCPPPLVDGNPTEDLPVPHGCSPPVLRARGNSQVSVGGNLNIENGCHTEFSPGSNVYVAGHFIHRARNAATFDLPGSTLWRLTLNGAAAAPQNFELASRDKGPPLSATTNGFVSNFAFDTLRIATGAHAVLSDSYVNNPATPGCEVLYVRNLVIEGGATLTLNGCRVYYNTLIQQPGAIRDLLNGAAIISSNAGDMDGDSDVDANDITTFVSALTGGLCNPACMAAADINGDGAINGIDVGVLAQILVY